MKLEEIFFEATDGLELSGLLYSSEDKTNKIIISVHGMASNCMKQRDYSIANAVVKEKVDYFAFNNRGHDLISYSRKPVGGKEKSVLMGTSYEEVLESYDDIKGAIQKVQQLGYTDIYLQGHSLGCTKIVYTYNRLLGEKEDVIIKSIKAVLLLSLIDIQGAQKHVLKEKYDTLLEYAIAQEKEKKLTQLMPTNAFIWPISVQTYLRYFRDNEKINIARYAEENDFIELNKINLPIFMRWGNVGDLLVQKAEELVEKMRQKLTQTKKDINYIEGTGHNYRTKEEVLAKQIAEFIRYI